VLFFYLDPHAISERLQVNGAQNVVLLGYLELKAAGKHFFWIEEIELPS
jgi:hypothetical protein